MTRSTALVSAKWLHEQLATDRSIVVVEIASEGGFAGTSADSHIPGARFVFWKDLCWDDTDRQFPTPETMARRLRDLGISDDSTIALVGDPFQYGTYAYWVLAMTGQESRTVLLDGGRQSWLNEGHALGPAVTEIVEGNVTAGELDESSRIGRSKVREHLGDPDVLLLDVRSDEEYNGERVSPSWFEVDYGAERRGRIPGAKHLYYGDLMQEDGTLLDRESLETKFEHLQSSATEIVAYCRLSHRATLAWFALTRVLDRSAVRVYDGSWTEWGTIVGYPIEVSSQG